MAYTLTLAEDFGTNFADVYDAPYVINHVESHLYVIAEGLIGYGNLTNRYITADKDVYSLGSLTTGRYVLDVDQYIWDQLPCCQSNAPKKSQPTRWLFFCWCKTVIDCIAI